MAQAVVGELACIGDRLRILLADSTTFRTLTGTADRTAALAFIHMPLSLDDGTHPPPRATIDPTKGNYEREQIGIGSYILQAQLPLSFEFEIPDSVTDGLELKDVESESELWFLGKVGPILEEMEALAGTGEGVSGETHLNVIRFTQVEGPEPYAEEEQPAEAAGKVPYLWFYTVMFEIR